MMSTILTCALTPVPLETGGDDGTRTHDPLLAKQVLFQLSYIPVLTCGFVWHRVSWTVAQHSSSMAWRCGRRYRRS